MRLSLIAYRSRDQAAAWRNPSVLCRSLLVTLTVLCGASVASLAQAQSQPEFGMKGMDPGYTKGTILGVQGYYEVTPSGAIVLYPSTPITTPGVMHTILGMFGAGSMVGRRGYFQIMPSGELFLYFPPGTAWPGMMGTQIAPGMFGQPVPPPNVQ